MVGVRACRRAGAACGGAAPRGWQGGPHRRTSRRRAARVEGCWWRGLVAAVVQIGNPPWGPKGAVRVMVSAGAGRSDGAAGEGEAPRGRRVGLAVASRAVTALRVEGCWRRGLVAVACPARRGRAPRRVSAASAARAGTSSGCLMCWGWGPRPARPPLPSRQWGPSGAGPGPTRASAAARERSERGARGDVVRLFDVLKVRATPHSAPFAVQAMGAEWGGARPGADERRGARAQRARRARGRRQVV